MHLPSCIYTRFQWMNERNEQTKRKIKQHNNLKNKEQQQQQRQQLIPKELRWCDIEIHKKRKKKVKWISVMLQNVTTTNTTISMRIFSFKSNAIEYFVYQHNLPLIVLLYEAFAIAKEPDNSIIWYAFALLFYFFFHFENTENASI